MRACAAVYTRSIVDHVLSASAKSPVAMVERPREVLLADNSAGGIQDSGQVPYTHAVRIGIARGWPIS